MIERVCAYPLQPDRGGRLARRLREPVARGQHHDRHVGVAAQLTADIATVAVGQGNVEEHEVGLGPSSQVERLTRATRRDRFEAGAPQGAAERLGDRSLVLHEQDPCGAHDSLTLGPSPAIVIVVFHRSGLRWATDA
jgi:hypothetical protein